MRVRGDGCVPSAFVPVGERLLRTVAPELVLLLRTYRGVCAPVHRGEERVEGTVCLAVLCLLGRGDWRPVTDAVYRVGCRLSAPSQSSTAFAQEHC